jgi:hypothetical protein
MIGVPFELSNDSSNPLDMVEELAESKEWKFTRHDDGLIDIFLPGKKAPFNASIEWQDEFSALLLACSLPVEIVGDNFGLAIEALERINQNLWLGHFDFSNQNKFPTFRHTLLLRMVAPSVAIDLIADVLDIAIAECNRFHTAFLLAQAGDERLHDDLHAAVFETIGEA